MLPESPESTPGTRTRGHEPARCGVRIVRGVTPPGRTAGASGEAFDPIFHFLSSFMRAVSYGHQTRDGAAAPPCDRELHGAHTGRGGH
eukprot:7035442-Prymnesium_polylepis.1